MVEGTEIDGAGWVADIMDGIAPELDKPDNRNLRPGTVWNHGFMRELAGDTYATFVR